MAAWCTPALGGHPPIAQRTCCHSDRSPSFVCRNLRWGGRLDKRQSQACVSSTSPPPCHPRCPATGEGTRENRGEVWALDRAADEGQGLGRGTLQRPVWGPLLRAGWQALCRGGGGAPRPPPPPPNWPARTPAESVSRPARPWQRASVPPAWTSWGTVWPLLLRGPRLGSGGQLWAAGLSRALTLTLCRVGFGRAAPRPGVRWEGSRAGPCTLR